MENKVMKAAVLYGKEDLRLEKYPVPEIKDDEVLVKIKSNGLCGSDIHFYADGKLGPFIVDEPYIPGHEASGVIEKKGHLVPDNVKIGDRVVLEPGIPCRKCSYCKSGRYNLCKDVIFLSAPPVNGTFADYAAVPYDFVYNIPDNVDFEIAALIEPLSVAIHAFERIGLKAGARIAILGAGPIGLINLILSKAYGVSEVTMIDVIPNRLKKAEEFGAEHLIDNRAGDAEIKINKITNGHGVDFVIDTTGSSIACAIAPQLSARGGKIALIGWPEKGSFQYPIEAVIDKELDIVGINRYCNTYQKAVSMISSGQLSLSRIISHRYSFDEVCEAFAFGLKERISTLKIIINHE